jgi:hypothetical protein
MLSVQLTDIKRAVRVATAPRIGDGGKCKHICYAHLKRNIEEPNSVVRLVPGTRYAALLSKLLDIGIVSQTFWSLRVQYLCATTLIASEVTFDRLFLVIKLAKQVLFLDSAGCKQPLKRQSNW